MLLRTFTVSWLNCSVLNPMQNAIFIECQRFLSRCLVVYSGIHNSEFKLLSMNLISIFPNITDVDDRSMRNKVAVKKEKLLYEVLITVTKIKVNLCVKNIELKRVSTK